MNNKKADLTVIILTHNEEAHIERCITSFLSLVKDVYVVDSYSSDNTVDICESLGVKVELRAWKNYADQFQWALDNLPIQTEWVMRLDADEYFNPELANNIPPLLSNANKDTTGYLCKRRNTFLGKKIIFGGYDPISLLRIWRHGFGRIESRWMDEHIVLSKGNTESVNGELIHDNIERNSVWTDKHNKYADREMIDVILKKYGIGNLDDQLKNTDSFSAKFKRHIKERIYNRLPLFIRPTLYFIFRYFICLGFLDGKAGFAYHFLQGYWYRSLVDVRIYEVERLILRSSSDPRNIIAILEKFTGHKLSESE